MPLTPAAAQTCAQQIVNALNIPSDVQAQALNEWTTVVNAIFDAIVLNAVVLPTTAGAPTLLAPPGAAGGPVTGVGQLE